MLKFLRSHYWNIGLIAILLLLFAFTRAIQSNYGAYGFESLSRAALPFAFATAAQVVVVIAGGMSIGEKGMIVAAKTLAMTAVDLFTTPELVAAAKAEHTERVGEGFVYTPLLGDRPPPLDYRVNNR